MVHVRIGNACGEWGPLVKQQNNNVPFRRTYDMNTKQIKRLAEQGDHDQAIAESNKLLEDLLGDKTDILRTRAYVYSLMGDYENALQDREAITQSTKAELKDYYQAGDSAIMSGNFMKAASYLKTTLLLGQQQNEAWFDSAASFLLAYAELEMGQYENALKSLDHAVILDEDCAMPLPEIGMCDHKCLREEILRRQEKGR